MVFSRIHAAKVKTTRPSSSTTTITRSSSIRRRFQPASRITAHRPRRNSSPRHNRPLASPTMEHSKAPLGVAQQRLQRQLQRQRQCNRNRITSLLRAAALDVVQQQRRHRHQLYPASPTTVRLKVAFSVPHRHRLPSLHLVRQVAAWAVASKRVFVR